MEHVKNVQWLSQFAGHAAVETDVLLRGMWARHGSR
jgi:hypothetical protein